MASNDQRSNFKSVGEVEKEKQTFGYRVGSKARMCLLKILHIITTIPPPLPTPPPPSAAPSTEKQEQPSSSNASQSKRGSFDVDLNLTLFDTEGNQQNLESPASESTVVSAAKKIPPSGEECDTICGTLHDEEKKDKKSLELLIEAAKFVSGGEFGKEEKMASQNKGFSELTRKPRRRRCWKNEVAEVEDYVEDDDVMLSPVVRTKRGRTQVLPCKYRDSILEPLTRLSRPNRSSNPVPTKRRSTSSRTLFI